MPSRVCASVALFLALALGVVSPARPAPPTSWTPPGPPKSGGAAPATKAQQVLSYDGIVDRGQFLPDTAVLARVNDRVTRVGAFIDAYFSSYAEDRPKADSAGRVEFLNSIVNKEVLGLTALAINRPLGFEDRAKLRAATERILSSVLYQRAVVESVTVTEDEMKRVYEQYRYRQHMRHILFADRSTAEKVRKDLVSKRVAWKDAVRKHSLAPDREHDGDLGWSARVNFDPILADQVYTLEPGQISPVIRDSQGYQLFQCIEHQPMDPPAYEGIRSLIRGQIRAVKTAQRVAALQGLVREEIGMAYDTTAITWASAHFTPTMTSHQDVGGPSLEFNVDLPEFTPADTARTLATYRGGRFSLGDFFAAYTAISALARPSVADFESMRSQIDGFVFEPHMAELARRRGLEKDSLVVSRIEGQREQILVDHMYQDSILSKVVVLPEEGRQFYQKNISGFVTYPRVRFAAFARPSRAGADSVAERLRSGAKADDILRADSLQGRVSGSIQERSGREHGTAYYKLLFEELRPGKVSVEGPDRQGVYAVIQLLSYEPGRQLSYQEAQDIVDESLMNSKSEERLKEFLARHRKRYRIEAHPELLMRVRLADPTLLE